MIFNEAKMTKLTSFFLIVADIFRVSFVIYMGVIVIEKIEPDFFMNINFFYQNWILLVLVISGAITILIKPKDIDIALPKKYFEWLDHRVIDWLFSLLTAIFAGGIMYYAKFNHSWVNIVISLCVALLSFVVAHSSFLPIKPKA